jgi:hypothetical protein
VYSIPQSVEDRHSSPHDHETRSRLGIRKGQATMTSLIQEANERHA